MLDLGWQHIEFDPPTEVGGDPAVRGNRDNRIGPVGFGIEAQGHIQVIKPFYFLAFAGFCGHGLAALYRQIQGSEALLTVEDEMLGLLTPRLICPFDQPGLELNPPPPVSIVISAPMGYDKEALAKSDLI